MITLRAKISKTGCVNFPPNVPSRRKSKQRIFSVKSQNAEKMTAETLEGPAVHPKLREKLEKMEIESPGCVVPFEVYGQLLAVYLHDNDL